MLTCLRSTNRRSLVALTLLCLLGLTAPAAQAAPITIDDFSSPGSFGGAGVTLGAVGTTGLVTDGPPLAGVVEGANATRGTTLNFDAGLGTVNLTLGGGDLSYTSTGTADGSFSLLYDANATLVIDLTDNATNNTFGVGVGSNTAGTPVTVTLTDDALNFFSLTLPTTGAPGDLLFPLAGFVGIDLTQIQSILIAVNPAAGASITLTAVVATPEPASLLVFATMGLVAIGYRSIRRRPFRGTRR
jgi:hypothetical protein